MGLLSLWTGITFVGLFSPIEELVAAAPHAGWSGWETFWVLFYAAATWGNAGFLREQVCRSLCPFARLQPLLTDPHTPRMLYDARRGEPRGMRPSGLGRARTRPWPARSDHRAGLRVPRCTPAAGRTDAHLQRRPPGRLHRLRCLCQRLPDATGYPPGTQADCLACGACLEACSQQQHQAGFGPGLVRYCSPQAMAGQPRQWWRPRTLALLSMLLALLACGAWRLL